LHYHSLLLKNQKLDKNHLASINFSTLSKITFDNFSLLIRGYSSEHPLLSIIVTILVSVLKPASSFETSLATIKSKFFFSNFSLACFSTFSVSAANPTIIWFSFFLPKLAAISGFLIFFISSISSSPVFFFIFSLLILSGL